MITNLAKLIICTNCGSPKYLEDYPAKGQKMCSKCGHESIEVQLKIIKTQDEIPDNCSFCGTEGEPEDLLYEDEKIMVILVYKCKKREKLDGFAYMNLDEPYYDYDEVYDPFFVKIAEQEGSPIHSASKCRVW